MGGDTIDRQQIYLTEWLKFHLEQGHQTFYQDIDEAKAITKSMILQF